jgi:asparaginyl-tRNA synthetase
MRDNDEDGGETVNPIDLLVPGVGEIVGESQRVRLLLIMCICVGMLNSHTKMLKLQQEERLDVLIEKIKDLELDVDDYGGTLIYVGLDPSLMLDMVWVLSVW